jgi:hypothetical protein
MASLSSSFWIRGETAAPNLQTKKIYHPRQCCGSGINIPDPGIRIPDPKTATKERGEKKFVVKPFFVAANFTKL